MMSKMINFELSPLLSFHVFCHKKPNFLLDEDIYEEWAMFAVEEGCFRYTLSEISDTAKEGDIIICPPGQIFRRKAITPVTFHFMRFKWTDKQNNLIYTEDSLPTGKINISNKNRLYSTYSFLRELTGKSDLFSLLWKDHMLNDIWKLFFAEANTDSTLDSVNIGEDPLMNQAMMYMKDNFSKKICIQSISSSLGLSQVQFTRRFNAAFRITPINFLTTLRLKKAHRLLSDTKLTIDEIAVHCGYDNGYYFSRIFTKKMALTPSEYRKIHRI